MRKRKIIHNMPNILAAAIGIIMLAGVLFLMNYVKTMLYSDVRINLAEVVTQNKDVITSKLAVELNNIDMIAQQLEDRLKQQSNADPDTLQSTFMDFAEGNMDLNVATKQGMAFFADGSHIDISGRKYFLLAVSGTQNISDRTISRKDGQEIFIISVPLYYQGEVIGTVQKQYTPEEIYQICAISLYSSQGYMNIINREGYIVLSSVPSEYSKESDNYFRYLYAQGNEEQSQKLASDIQQDHAGLMEVTLEGDKIFSAYTPIEELHDWYLITSVSSNAISRSTKTVVQMFYVILCITALIFTGFILYFLTYKNRQQAKLERIAFVDTVTGGNTYNKFEVDLRETLEKNPEKQYFLFAFDIDNFRYINNFYGFDFGDRILNRIYHKISSLLRSEETAARTSSDHFVLLLEDATEQRMTAMLDALQNEEDVMLYLSAGVYTITDPQESVNLMVDKATTAAQNYKGVLHKHVGWYSVQFDQQMIHNEQLKRSIEQALANGEIIPFFQPKVDIHTRRLMGAEALARWRKADGKLVSPAEFIPLCEQTGMIVELDFEIFTQTLRFLRRNLDAGVACVPISVNFSRHHLLSKGFIDNIMACIHKYHVPPHLIELELTESVIFDNSKTITDFIEQIHQQGLQISMDDFGSGYSSLNMLKDVPIDVLKIDRGFLQETSNSDRQMIIFSAISQMAKQLEIKVVVEGVETIENVKMMCEFGCQIAQGYYFSRPLDEKTFEKIFHEGQL